MNFENYNNIYKEILDDEAGDLSANYLLNKYEIKHDEELLNILNQIKKNEYISSGNKIINRLIKELDENEELLDVNEIINIKDKVINAEDFNLDSENNEEIETNEIIEDKSKNHQEIIENTRNNKNYVLYILPLLVLLGTIYFVATPSEDEKEILIAKIEPKTQEIIIKKEETQKPEVAKVEEKVIETEEVVLNEKTIENKIEEEVDESIEITADNKNILPEVEEKIEITFNSEIALDKIEEFTNESNIVGIPDTPKLKSLSEINKYIKKLTLENGKIFYDGNYYSENSMLFGFKVFKITPLYVKFEDVNKKIRKRFLITKK